MVTGAQRFRLPQGFRIVESDRRADPILKNLFEHYLHDMAEWFEFDTHENGAYRYPTERIWEEGYRVFLLYREAIPAGFALVGSGEEFIREAGVHDVDEFFVIRRYRRAGVGRAFVTTLWDETPGDWLVRVFQRNLPAMGFWRATVAAYSGGAFTETVHHVNDNPWSYFLFRSVPDGAPGISR